MSERDILLMILRALYYPPTMLPVDIQEQYKYLATLVAPYRDAIAKYLTTKTVSFGDEETVVAVWNPPSDRFWIVWRIEIETDANTEYAAPIIDDVLVDYGAGPNQTRILSKDHFPWGIPCKTAISLRGKAASGTTASVRIRAWIWELPNELGG